MALCGACTVHVNGQATRSCSTPLSSVAGKRITTIEAIGQTKEGKAVQDAWVANDVPQCGYCQSGQIMSAAALLSRSSADRRRNRRGHEPATCAAAAPTTASASR